MGSLPLTQCMMWAEGTQDCGSLFLLLQKVTTNGEASHKTSEMHASSVGQKTDRSTGLASRS